MSLSLRQQLAPLGKSFALTYLPNGVHLACRVCGTRYGLRAWLRPVRAGNLLALLNHAARCRRWTAVIESEQHGVPSSRQAHPSVDGPEYEAKPAPEHTVES